MFAREAIGALSMLRLIRRAGLGKDAVCLRFRSRKRITIDFPGHKGTKGIWRQVDRG